MQRNLKTKKSAQNIFRRTACALLIGIIISLCAGCKESFSDDETYSVSYGQSAAQYTLFANKAITNVLNLVSTQQLALQTKTYEKSAVLYAEDLDQSLVELAKIYKDVKTTNPASQYEEKREILLKNMDDLKQIFVGIQTLCDKNEMNDSTLSEYKSKLQALFIALTNQFSVS